MQDVRRLLAAASSLVVGALLFVGCGSTPFSTVTPTSNPLVAEYSVNPARNGTVTVDFGETTDYGMSTSPVATTVGPATVLVAGMKPNTTYHMRATANYEDGSSHVDDDHVFTTGSLPPGLIPRYTVTATPGLTPQPGIEFIDTLQGATASTAYATDLAGNVIWFYPFTDTQPLIILYPVKLLPNGHFMGLISPNSIGPLTAPIPPGTLNEIREFDLVGNLVRHLTMTDLNARLAAAGFNVTLQLFHHDFAPLPNGHILVIANTLKSFTNLTGIPGTTQVLGDVVVDLDENFNPVFLWNEFDHLDVNRHPFMFPDWTHSNAIAYSPDDGNFLISIRHQSWIIKVDYRNGAGTGNIIWKLGQAGDFTLQGGVDPTDWFYAQHDVNFVSPNTTGSFQLAIMDNGDTRIFPSGLVCNAPGAPACYSTVPVMQVDENAKTASFLFHQILPPNLYNIFAGDTRVQPNTNIEYNLAGVGANSYVMEVTPTATPQTVWQMEVTGTNTYRAYRMPSLYPGVQW
ncbi:MAG TPA: aryl-sulfate sulfotransferase [Acidobacteriaceae bacterium]|nr:aryl-sulfate sulfotransferase [Acidobacteriaceae bacterium]